MLKLSIFCVLLVFLLSTIFVDSQAFSLPMDDKVKQILNNMIYKQNPDIPISSFYLDAKNGTLVIMIDRCAPYYPYYYEDKLHSILGNRTIKVEYNTINSSCFTTGPVFPTSQDQPIKVNMKIFQDQNFTKYIHFRFFDLNTNQTIQNVSFFINATNQNKTLIRDLFFTQSGLLKLDLKPKVSSWTVNGNMEPILGGYTNKTDEISLFSPLFIKSGLYHFEIEILAIEYVNNIVDQSNPPKFDSWWFMDDAGNISNVDISKPSWIKNTYHWWSSGKISDQEFTNEIQYLINKNIIISQMYR